MFGYTIEQKPFSGNLLPREINIFIYSWVINPCYVVAPYTYTGYAMLTILGSSRRRV